MKGKRESLGLALICLAVVAASAWGLVAAFQTRIELNVDGIMLLCSGLLMGGLFLLMLFLLAREQGWIPRRQQENPAANPAPANPAAGKSKPMAPETK